MQEKIIILDFSIHAVDCPPVAGAEHVLRNLAVQ